VKKLTLGVMAGVMVLALAPTAVASPQFKQEAEAEYTTTKAESRTGLKVRLAVSDPGAPNQIPAAATRIVITLRGARIDDDAVDKCTASDSAVITGACRSSTRIGSGTAIAKVGQLGGQQITETITVYNGNNQVIVLLKKSTAPGALGQDLVLRGRVSRGNKITLAIPPLPFQTVLTAATLNVSREGTRREPLIRTPRTCRGSFSNVIQHTYTSGQAPTTITTRQRCRD
jgi:hypothetical protein